MHLQHVQMESVKTLARCSIRRDVYGGDGGDYDDDDDDADNDADDYCLRCCHRC